MTQLHWDEPLDVKGLAIALKRAESYVYDMRTMGFFMPGGRATVRMAMCWLSDHPDFSRRQAAFARRTRSGKK